MTGHDDFDRTLAGWFEADALAPAPAGDLERVLDATRRRRPLPAWLAGLGGRWVGDAQNAGSMWRVDRRWSMALILLLVGALIGGAILVGARLFQPSPLPAGRLGHLAYGLDGDIYVADWDGRNPVRVADGLPGFGPAACGSNWGEGPIWSPDGRHFAYRSAAGDRCAGTVVITDPATKSVASFLGTGWLVSWSPDSTRVASWVDLGQTIGVYGFDGARQALLTLPPGHAVEGDYDPVWSPDGRSLLIRLAPPRPSEVWELPVDGGTPRPVPTDDPRSHWDASYSRDGSRVAFNDGGYLVVADADGGQRRLLAQAGDSIVWSPTGDRVAFTWGFDSSEPPGNLRVMDVANGNVWEVPGGQPIGFSPEGDRILYSQTGRNRETNRDESTLWSVNVENFRIDDGSNGRSLYTGDLYQFDTQQLVTGTSWGDWQWQPADR